MHRLTEFSANYRAFVSHSNTHTHTQSYGFYACQNLETQRPEKCGIKQGMANGICPIMIDNAYFSGKLVLVLGSLRSRRMVGNFQ